MVMLSAGMVLAEEFKFISMADSRGDFMGVNKPILEKIVVNCIADEPDFILYSGDFINGNKDMNLFKKQMENFKSIIKPLTDRYPVYYSYGNHEFSGPAQVEYMRTNMNNPATVSGKYEKLIYSFDHKGSHFICLTTNLPGENNMLSNEQLNWLEGDLKMSINAEHVFVFGHSPAYPVGSHIGSALDKYPAQRDKFWSLLNKYRVDAYFCGHEHLYDRQRINNVFQIINGSCGAPIKSKVGRGGTEDFSGSFFHHVLVNISGPDVTFSTYDENKKLRDKFRLSRRVLNEMHSGE
ncbi:MAG TPA: metallophosphoesterase [Candidatus Wallbacteria bacterium]|nr:metallophosphoesterase [Candidatus Wallbacteria bacterium]